VLSWNPASGRLENTVFFVPFLAEIRVRTSSAECQMTTATQIPGEKLETVGPQKNPSDATSKRFGYEK
jgi:hypothetical protein